jgi:hypothetical protein
MRGLLATFIAFAMLFGAGEAAGAQRKKPQQHTNSSAVVHTDGPQQPVSSRSTRPNRAISASPTFRAEDIVPDICKGCSS